MDSWVKTIKDSKMKLLIETAQNIASRKATVLVQGESGVGKELMARFIHNNSQRSSYPFVAVNCAALPENLLESELFGYEKGAFTGASSMKPGKFEMAHKGTFLLDEVSELPLLLQGKLLRVLQESEVERLGGTSSKKIDVRIICTSNKSLSQMVKDGTFRQDLFYRLNVIPLEIPALRQRKKDISSLVRTFLQKVATENKMRIKDLDPSALNKIMDWSWPGNIRELQNVIERSCLISQKSTLSAEDIQIDTSTSPQVSQKKGAVLETGMTIQEAERLLILKTLEHTGENRTHAAKILGISIRTLRNKLNEYRLKSATQL